MAHEPVDPLVDFETLLKQELAVTPSAEFLPRVRERVRLEPGPTRWSRAWRFAPLAAAATLALAAGLAHWTATGTTGPVAPTPPSVVLTSVAAHANVPDSAAGAEHPPSRVSLRRASRVPSTENRVPSTEHRVPALEVIVDQRQREALVSMIRLINQGQLTEESFKDTRRPPITIGIAPVAVSPIVVGGVLSSEGERK